MLHSVRYSVKREPEFVCDFNVLSIVHIVLNKCGKLDEIHVDELV